MKIATASLALLAAKAVGIGEPKPLQAIDLAEHKWMLESQPPNVSVPGSVPSHVHLDLLNAGTIEDPFVCQHSKTVCYIDDECWLTAVVYFHPATMA